MKVKLLSHVRLFVTPWTAAYQAPLSMGFSKQEYWSGLPLPSPREVLDTPKEGKGSERGQEEERKGMVGRMEEDENGNILSAFCTKIIVLTKG